MPSCAWPDQIETAKTHFGQVLKQQPERVERLKAQPDLTDFSKISSIKIGMIGADGIGPSVVAQLQAGAVLVEHIGF